MYILNYLFYKYYWFQVKIGNKDNAVFNTILMITSIISLYIVTLFMIFIFFIITNIKIKIQPFYGVITGGGILFLLIYNFSYKRKYKKIIMNEKYKNKSNFIAIMLPFLGFLLFNSIWILKMFQNR
jgi:hypothetical protein